MERKMGVLEEKPSALLYDYDVVCADSAMGGTLPEEFMIPKENIPDCRDQKTTGQCVAFATTNVMQILNQIETGERVRFSTTYVYGRHREETERTLEGMYPEKVLGKLKHLGSVYEEDLPQLLEVPEAYDYVKAHPELDEKAEPFKISSYVGFASADQEVKTRQIKHALFTYQVPLLGIMDMQNATHAISLVGWNKTGFIYMNSWGKSSGEDGICEVKYKTLRRAYLMLDAKNTNAFPFVDVSENHWAKEAILHCYNAGLINGMDETHFAPDEPLTRAQMCQILYKYIKKTEGTKNG